MSRFVNCTRMSSNSEINRIFSFFLQKRKEKKRNQSNLVADCAFLSFLVFSAKCVRQLAMPNISVTAYTEQQLGVDCLFHMLIMPRFWQGLY